MLNVSTWCDTDDVHLSIPCDDGYYRHTRASHDGCRDDRAFDVADCKCVRPLVAMLQLLLSKYERPSAYVCVCVCVDVSKSPQLSCALSICLSHSLGRVCVFCFKFNSVSSCWPINFRGNCKYLNDR